MGPDLRGECTQQGRLPGARGPGDNHLLARLYRGGKETPERAVDRAATFEVGEGHPHQAVPSDRQARAIAHPRHREEPASVRELQVQRRSTWVELPLGEPVTAADLTQ